MALTKRPFPAAVMARSAMTVAVEEIVRALEGPGQRPGSTCTARARSRAVRGVPSGRPEPAAW